MLLQNKYQTSDESNKIFIRHLELREKYCNVSFLYDVPENKEGPTTTGTMSNAILPGRDSCRMLLLFYLHGSPVQEAMIMWMYLLLL